MANSGAVILVMRQGPRLNQAYELTKDVYTIGREAGNDIVLEDSQISRHHARLSRQENSYVIEDLGSTNGVFVNGRRVSNPVLLSNGDMLGFADTVVLAVQIMAPAADATIVSHGAGATTVGAPPTAPAFAPPPPPPPPMRQPQPQMQQPVQQPVQQQPVMQQQPMMQQGYAQPKKSNTGRYVMIGIGCLALLLIVAAIGVVAWSFIDCASFRSVFGSLLPISC